MNQLNFSPISQKEEQSIDAFSFLQQQHTKTYKKSHQHKIKLKPNPVQAATRMFLRLERTINNRKSYGFQLLKQFILFSSEQQTIEVPYKYSHYQLDGAFKILENTLGLKIQKTYLNAFEDLYVFAEKRKVYSNVKNLNALTKITNKIDKRINQYSFKQSFIILKKFAVQQIFSSNRNNQYKDKMSQQSRSYNLKLNTLTSLKNDKHMDGQKQLTRKNKLKYNMIQTPSPLLSQKLQTIMHERQQQFQTNQWRDDTEDVHLFEDHSDQEYRQDRIQIKSNRKYEKEFLESTRHKNSTFMRTEGRENKCFTLATPGRNRGQFEDAFETQRRKNSDNKQDDEGVQNVIVIRSSKKYKRQPDRYIRVPILSEQVKIIQLIPESSRRNTQRLQTNSSRQNSHHSHSSKKPRENKETHKYYEQEYLQAKLHSSRKDERKYKMKTKQDRDEWDHNHNQCFGCKYCQVIKDMESFRLQRAQQTMKIHNFI